MLNLYRFCLAQLTESEKNYLVYMSKQPTKLQNINNKISQQSKYKKLLLFVFISRSY